MSNLERICQALLFEAGAILLTVLLMRVATSHQTGELTLTIVLISVIALIWNVFFNFVFDKLFQGEKVHRSWAVRTLHTISFELGLLIFTLPLVAFILHVSWWEAFVMDISMTLFVMFYTLIFHWCYDHIRHWLSQHR
ncbi:membrane protein [Bibersteinia trehalosi USDA-ARS-USMARC-188]|uniref:Membrane protein n=1 Tax=Bibersteinia trehalosi USDA-ARS-USMARC-188 TaxID=1263829 RepID=A0A4V7ICF9_BIBTR|nr:PACE efflux transporter [Bibersteinia trehalosi]AHG82686.1 membrane protein [Bibersteinia trehalosi USDA-ARS-USMARC-188]